MNSCRLLAGRSARATITKGVSAISTTGEASCGSPIVSFVEVVPELAFVKAGTLDDASWIAPAIEIWSRSAQPWSPHFEGVPVVERGPGSEPAPLAG